MKVRVDSIYEQKALIAARSYNEGLEVQREQVEKTKNELRRLRHDIRSDAGTLYSLLEVNEIEDVKSALKEYIEKTQSGSLELYCQNPYVNSVVSESFARLKELGITVDPMISLNENLDSKEEDVAIILEELFKFAYYVTRESRGLKNLSLWAKHQNEKIFIELIIPIAASEPEPDFQPDCEVAFEPAYEAKSESDAQQPEPGFHRESQPRVQPGFQPESAYDESQLVALELIIDKIGGIIDIDTTQTGITVRILI